MTTRLLSVLLLLVLGACAKPPDDAPSFDPGLAAEIEARLAAAFEESRAPGAAVAVMLPDGSMYETALGDAVVAEREMTASDTLRIGSVTKTFVAALVLQLAAEGAIALDAPLDAWVPDFALGEAVTIRRLLDHTGGIYSFTDDPAFLSFSAKTLTASEVISWALEHGPVFAPGQGWSYSNTGYLLLGLLIERMTGRPLDVAVRERLTDGLGLTSPAMESEAAPSTAAGHVGGGGAPTFEAAWNWAAGGMVANAGDLCRWLRELLLGDRVLPFEWREAQRTPAVLPGGRTAAYGLGVYLVRRGGRAVIGHTGSTMGFRGEVFLDPDGGTCVAVLTNDFLADQKVLSAPLWDALVGR